MSLRSAVAPTTPGSDTRIEVLRDAARVAEIAPSWAALLARSSCNRAFSSPIWFGAWLEVFDEFTPYVVVARRSDELVGILPLAITPNGDAVLSPCNWCDYNDVIADDDDHRVAAALVAWSLSGREARRQVILRRVRHDSCLARALALLLGRDPLVDPSDSPQYCQYIDLAQGYQHYMAGRSSTFRKGLARARRRAREGGIDVRELWARSDSPGDLAAQFLAVHLERFGQASCFYPDRARRFLATALPALFLEGRVRAFGAFAGGRLVALDLCLVGPFGLSSWNGGFLAGVAAFSPGTLLLDFQIRQLASEGLTELDLLRGDQAWKRRWSTGRRRLGYLVLEAIPTPGTACPGLAR
jgi:CelD/BcsL family acetyltransferase involved in cellulose biosynthesis